MTLGSGIVSGPKHHYHWPREPQQYLTILPDFIGWCLFYMNAISPQIQLQPCFRSFYIYSLFSGGESPSLVKNVEVKFELKPRHPISRGNISAILNTRLPQVFVLFQFTLMCSVDVDFEIWSLIQQW